MATTTAKAFGEFSDRISLSQSDKDRVDSRLAAVENYLKNSFPPSSDLPVRAVNLMGSARRDTIIRPFNDIDVLAEFRNKDNIFERYRGNSQTFLYRIREVINANTTIKQVGARGQAVRLFYTDGLHVDIAPVFRWTGSGYALPAGDGSWLTTDPPKQRAWINERNEALGGRLKQRVRMLKCWNSAHSTRLGSWHLEVMVASVFKSMGKNSREVLVKFFEWAPNYISVRDPDGHGGDLSAGMSWKTLEDLRTTLASAHSRATKADAAEKSGNHREAIRLWGIILGDQFPVYTGS